MIRHPDTPANGQLVLVRMRARHNGGDWGEYTIHAVYYDEPFASELGHFHDNFGFDDSDCVWHEVEIIDWIGF